MEHVDRAKLRPPQASPGHTLHTGFASGFEMTFTNDYSGCATLCHAHASHTHSRLCCLTDGFAVLSDTVKVTHLATSGYMWAAKV